MLSNAEERLTINAYPLTLPGLGIQLHELLDL